MYVHGPIRKKAIFEYSASLLDALRDRGLLGEAALRRSFSEVPALGKDISLRISPLKAPSGTFISILYWIDDYGAPLKLLVAREAPFSQIALKSADCFEGYRPTGKQDPYGNAEQVLDIPNGRMPEVIAELERLCSGSQ